MPSIRWCEMKGEFGPCSILNFYPTRMKIENMGYSPIPGRLLVPDGLCIFLNNKVDQMDHRDCLKAGGTLIHGDAALLQ